MLTEKIALVTGAGRGIGRAIAVAMAKAGAHVALLYERNEQAALETQALIAALGRKAMVYQCDVGDFQSVKETVAQVISDFGGIDVLVNNAGVTRDGLLLTMQPEQFTAVLQTNLTGAFHMIRQVCGHFLRKRAGRIINISSVAGLMGNAGQCNYAAAKAGMIGMTKSVARELAGRNITCNAIAPGFIETDMTAAMPEKAAAAMLSHIPMGKMGKPEDVAGLAVFLASEQASYITGEVIKVDGGMYM